MSTPRTRPVSFLLDGAFRRMAVHEWGDPSAPPVICVHGLTRNGRDFDALAQALSARFRVLCPDLPGRGASDWLDSGAQYQPPSYVAALSHLLAALPPCPVRWVGTSLGGICGMMVAAARDAPVSHLVLNDIGPHVPAAALARIRGYMADAPVFADLAALEAHLRRVHAPFGRLTDAQWAHLARHSARPLPDGRLALHYDPQIAGPVLAGTPQDLDLWPVYGAVRAPVLAIRGANSDLLRPDTLDAMRRHGAATLVVPDAGHAPALMDEASIAAVAAFLGQTASG